MATTSRPDPPPQTQIHKFKHNGGPVHTVIYNENGRYALSGGQDKSVRLWNVQKGTEIKAYEGHGYEVLGVAVSPDNSRFASCGGDRQVFWWDVGKGVTLKRFQGHSARVNAVALNHEASVCASGGYDASVRLWDLKSQQRMPIQILSEAKDSITCVIIRDGLVITGCVDGYVRTYDLRKGELRADFFDQPVTSVSLTPDSASMIVTTLAAPDDAQAVPGTVRLIDCSNGSLLQTFKGHRSASYRCGGTFGREDRSVLQGDEDGKVFAWSVESGETLGSFKAHDKTVTWVARHPKSEDQILTAGADGSIIAWGR